jgi:hypothetical protein
MSGVVLKIKRQAERVRCPRYWAGLFDDSLIISKWRNEWHTQRKKQIQNPDAYTSEDGNYTNYVTFMGHAVE